MPELQPDDGDGWIALSSGQGWRSTSWVGDDWGNFERKWTEIRPGVPRQHQDHHPSRKVIRPFSSSETGGRSSSLLGFTMWSWWKGSIVDALPIFRIRLLLDL